MSCSRTSRVAALILALLAIAVVSCKDDLPDPTRADLQLRFRSEPANLARGAEVWIDGSRVVESLDQTELGMLLDEGTHTIVVYKECVRVSPAETLVVEIDGGRPQTIDYQLSLRCALLRIHIQTSAPGLADGSQIWIDGEMVIESLAGDDVELLLEPGPHEIEIRKDCVTADPDIALVNLGEGVVHDLEIALSSAAVLSVVSNPAGLPIWLDGAATGDVTPASYPCIDPGDHEVRVSPGGGVGFDVAGDSVRTVTIPSEGSVEAAFEFATTPRAQSRGVMLELFTATLCPNCPPADHAIDHLQRDPAYAEGTMAALEVHLSWGGTDPFHNEEIAVRRVSYYYGNDAQSAPIAYFNGLDRVVGSNLADIEETYRQRIALTYGADAKVGLYWIDAQRDGSMLRGNLRLVAIDEISGFDKPELIAYYAKDSLTATFDPFGVGKFMGVVRDYSDPLDLKAAGLASAGSYADIDIDFDLSIDSAPADRPLRLGAFVQDRTSKEVLQLREVYLPRP